MENKTYGILDIAKFISALLVIAVHCAPFADIDETLNFVYVQILARLAVPFFFIASGWLFFRKIDPEAGWRAESNLNALKRYLKRIARIYAVWSLLYLPLLAYSWLQGGFTLMTLIRLVRDFFFTGTYYHLWFLSALLWGVPLVYWMYTHGRRRTLLCVSLLLYIVGMAVNVYGELLVNVPVIGSLVMLYERVLVTTRNGLFFAPIFLTLGIYSDELIGGQYKKSAGLAFIISLIVYIAEAVALRYGGLMNDLTCMYATLVPTVFFLFLFLMQFTFPTNAYRERLRQQSLLIYVSHIYFVQAAFAAFPNAHLTVYVFSIVGAVCFSSIIVWLNQRGNRCGFLM